MGSGAVAGGLAPLPPEGLVLKKGQKLKYWRDGRRCYIGRSLMAGKNYFPPLKELHRESHPHNIRLEAIRKNRRDSELSGRQAGTLLKGALVEGIYRGGRRSAEREQAKRQQGQKGRSVLGKVLGGLFR